MDFPSSNLSASGKTDFLVGTDSLVATSATIRSKKQLNEERGDQVCSSNDALSSYVGLLRTSLLI